MLAAAPQLSCGLEKTGSIYQSSDGVVDLTWKPNQELTGFELQEAVEGDGFEGRYRGPDTSSVRSGLQEGLHRFRVREIGAEGEPGPWSEVLAVKVSYMDGGRVKALMMLGGLVVLATVFAILHGHFTQERKEDSA